MAANAIVRARIDETLKNEAADVLAGMGLTVSDLIRITLTKVAREKALPSICAFQTNLQLKPLPTVKKVWTFIKRKTLMISLINWVSYRP